MKKVTVRFLKHPGQFRLGYHVGETGVFEKKQADEIAAAGVGVIVETEPDLPEDLPGRNYILKAGLNYEELSQVKDLTEIKGITPATGKKIVEYLNNKK